MYLDFADWAMPSRSGVNMRGYFSSAAGELLLGLALVPAAVGTRRAVGDGCAPLQGLATCGICSRKLAVYYDGKHKATPGYYCTGTDNMVEGRRTRHLRVGGVAIDAALTAAFLAALEPVALRSYQRRYGGRAHGQ